MQATIHLYILGVTAVPLTGLFARKTVNVGLNSFSQPDARHQRALVKLVL
jgi:hypothetical protein